MPTAQTIDSLVLAQKYHNVLFSSFWEAANIVAEASGVYSERPLNVPLNWKIKIMRQYGLKYINQADQQEWVKVIPPTLESRQRFSQHAIVIYHKPTKKVLKRFGMKSDPKALLLKDVKEFDQHNKEHLNMLDDIFEATKHLDPIRRSREAARRLKFFWISINDFLFIRSKLGFKDFISLPEFEKVLGKIKEDLLCNCFGTYISSSQLGVISKHNLDHYYSVRLAFHFGHEKPFIKICMAGDYRKADGSIIFEDESEAHLDFSSFLQGKFDWFQPLCKATYSFFDFNYEEVRHPIDKELRKKEKENRLIDYTNKKGAGYA